MTDANQPATDADIAASFAQQLQQRPPGEAEEAPPVDAEPEISETETEHTPPVEAEEAPGEPEIANSEAEPAEDLETEHLEPAIQPPVGLTAEQQAAFAQIDPGLQQALATREAQREASLTVKSEQLAQERRALEAQSAEVAQQRAQYAQMLQGVANQELKPPAASLAQEDPDLYQVQLAQYNEAKYAQDLAQAELTRVQSEHQAQLEKDLAAHKARVRAELPSLIPEMADPKKFDAIEAELTAYARSKGYQDEALDRSTSVDRHILWKAMMFDKGQLSQPGQRKQPPKAQRPGSARRPASKREAAQADVTRAAKKTAETGDLSHIYAARLKAEGKK